MTDSARLRVGIVGCGFFAPNHVHAWAHMPDIAIAGLCDTRIERARAMAERIGRDIPVFADLGEMIEQARPDFLDLVTSPETHAPLVHFAAERRMPAIVQKPMAFDLATARGMVEAMEKAGLPFMVHENFRFEAPIAAVGEIVRSGEIGRPVYAHIAFRTGHDIYAGQPYLATVKRFILADVGVHVLDVARFLMGEAVRVQCETQSVKPGLAGEDMATCLLRHASGAISVIECSYASKLADDPFPETMITVEGTEGAVALSRGNEIAVKSGATIRRFNATPPVLPWAAPPWHVVQDSVLRCNRDWVAHFRAGTEPQTSGRDNLATLALVEAAYQAAASGVAATPEPVPNRTHI